MGKKIYILDGSEILQRGRRLLNSLNNAEINNVEFASAVMEYYSDWRRSERTLHHVVGKLVRRLPSRGGDEAYVEDCYHQDVRTVIDAIVFSADEFEYVTKSMGLRWEGLIVRFVRWSGQDLIVSVDE